MVNNRWFVAWIILLTWFYVLITLHYLKAQPLWLDEGFIFNNLINRHGIEIFQQHLLSAQQFPKFYLWLIQQLTYLMNNCSVLVLRFLPFCAMVLGCLVWQLVATRASLSLKEKVVMTACWAASLQLIYYAAELKQYSFDVLASGLCTLWLISDQQRRWVYLLPLLGFMSYPVFIFFPLIVIKLVDQTKSFVKQTIHLWGVLAVMLLVTTFVYIYDMANGNSQMLKYYWQDYFISFNSLPEFLRSLGEGFNNLIGRWFGDMPKQLRVPSRIIIGGGLIWLIYAGIRDVRLRIKPFSIMMVVFGVLLGHLILGMLHVYAFVVPRTSLFIAPLLFIATAKAWGWLDQRQKSLGLIMLCLMGIYFLYITSGIYYAIVVKGYLGAQEYLWRL